MKKFLKRLYRWCIRYASFGHLLYENTVVDNLSITVNNTSDVALLPHNENRIPNKPNAISQAASLSKNQNHFVDVDKMASKVDVSQINPMVEITETNKAQNHFLEVKQMVEIKQIETAQIEPVHNFEIQRIDINIDIKHSQIGSISHDNIKNQLVIANYIYKGNPPFLFYQYVIYTTIIKVLSFYESIIPLYFCEQTAESEIMETVNAKAVSSPNSSSAPIMYETFLPAGQIKLLNLATLTFNAYQAATVINTMFFRIDLQHYGILTSINLALEYNGSISQKQASGLHGINAVIPITYIITHILPMIPNLMSRHATKDGGIAVDNHYYMIGVNAIFSGIFAIIPNFISHIVSEDLTNNILMQPKIFIDKTAQNIFKLLVRHSIMTLTASHMATPLMRGAESLITRTTIDIIKNKTNIVQNTLIAAYFDYAETDAERIGHDGYSITGLFEYMRQIFNDFLDVMSG